MNIFVVIKFTIAAVNVLWRTADGRPYAAMATFLLFRHAQAHPFGWAFLRGKDCGRKNGAKKQGKALFFCICYWKSIPGGKPARQCR